jgi:hypothetical protein
MPQYRVSLAFAQLPDVALDDFAGGVIAGMNTSAVAFPDPPVAVADLTLLKKALENTIAAAVQGGSSATAAKNNAYDALVTALRKDANYVEINCNNDLATLLSSGYQAASTNRAQSEIAKVQIIGIDHDISGQLKVRIQPVPNSKGFDGRIKFGNGDYGPEQSFASSKAIIFKNLTPGTTYTIQVRAVGGSTGLGDWSDPVSHMAM